MRLDGELVAFGVNAVAHPHAGRSRANLANLHASLRQLLPRRVNVVHAKHQLGRIVAKPLLAAAVQGQHACARVQRHSEFVAVVHEALWKRDLKAEGITIERHLRIHGLNIDDDFNQAFGDHPFLSFCLTA